MKYRIIEHSANNKSWFYVQRQYRFLFWTFFDFVRQPTDKTNENGTTIWSKVKFNTIEEAKAYINENNPTITIHTL